MTRGLICTGLVLVLAAAIVAQAGAARDRASDMAPKAGPVRLARGPKMISAKAARETTKPAETTRIVRLVVRPAAEPRPALRYQLLPDLLDQRPGNASTLYLSAASVVRDDTAGEFRDKIDAWRDAPPKDLPREEVRKALDKHKSLLRQIEMAAFREWCRWDTPIRTEGFSVLLPSLAKYRFLSKLLAVRIRLKIAQGNVDEVIRDLQIGFSLARHVAGGPTLIQALVGISIAKLMTEQVEAFLRVSDCPNLYWALTELPRPFIDLRKSLRYERSMFFLAFPQLRDPRKAELTRRQWERLANDVWTELNSIAGGDPGESPKLTFVALQAQLLAQAKRYLLDQGRTTEQVEAMPPQQVVAIHQIDGFNDQKDELFKWFALPYWQAAPKLREAEDALQDAAEQGDHSLGTILVPALTKSYAHATNLDRQIAALRCIEAVRLYAVGHDGKLPAALGDITEVPIPIDPITGKPFRYKLDGDKAVLEWAPPPGFGAKHGTRYELTIAR